MDKQLEQLIYKIIAQCNESIVYDNVADLQDGIQEIKNSCLRVLAEYKEIPAKLKKSK